MFKKILYLIKDEIDFILTALLMKGIDLLLPGNIGIILRAKILRLFGFKIGKKVKMFSNIMINKKSDNIIIGEGSAFNKNVFFDPGSAFIKIGKHCNIGFNAVFCCTSHSLKSNFNRTRQCVESNSITVEDYVWIGCNAVILGGVTLGKGSVVCAGSLVHKDVPPETLVAGVPARVVKSLKNDENTEKVEVVKHEEKSLVLN